MYDIFQFHNHVYNYGKDACYFDEANVYEGYERPSARRALTICQL